MEAEETRVQAVRKGNKESRKVTTQGDENLENGRRGKKKRRGVFY